jgi:PKD repeat protein
MKKLLIGIAVWLSAYSLQAQCTIQRSPTGAVCPGTPVRFTAITSLNDGPLSFLWDFGFGALETDSIVTRSFPNNSTATTYTVTLTVIDSSDTCVVSIPVNVLYGPQITFTGTTIADPAVYCVNTFPCGTPFTTTLSLNPGAAGLGPFTWDFGDGTPPLTSPSLSQTITYNQFGTYNVTVTAAGSTCPSVRTPVRFYTRLNNPDIDAPTSNFCEGDTVRVTNVGTPQCPGNVDYYLINWNNPFGQRDTVQNIGNLFNIYELPLTAACNLASFSTNLQYEIRLDAVNYCTTVTGIQTYNSSPVVVGVAAEPEFTFPATICAPNNTVTFTNLSCPQNQPTQPLSFRWNFGDLTTLADTSNAVNPSYTFPGPGVYNVTLIASNTQCGPRAITRQVTILEPPVANITASTNTGCRPLTVSFANNSTPAGNINYLWTVNQTQNWSITSGSNTSASPQFTFTAPGVYILTARLQNPCGTVFWRDTITVNDVPSVTIQALADSCGPVVYLPSATVADNGEPILSYVWNFGALGTPGTANTLVPPPVAFSPGNQNISLTVTNACGSRTATRAFLLAPTVALNAGPDTTNWCPGDPQVCFTPTPPGGSWRFNGLPSASNCVLPVASTITGVYTLDSLGCSFKDTVVIIPRPAPIIFAGNDTTICTGDTITLSGQNPTGGVFSGAGVLGGNQWTGTTSAVLTYTAADPITTCVGTDTRNVTVAPAPAVNAGADQTYCLSPVSINLPAASPAGGVWSGPGVSPAGVFSPSVAGLGVHTLVYTVNYGPGNVCSISDAIQVTVNAPQTPAVMPDLTLCRDAGAISLTATPAGGVWSGPAGLVLPSTFNPLIAATGVNTFIYTLFPNSSCEQRDTLRITVTDTVTLVAGPALSACTNGNNFTLGGFSPAGGVWSGAPVVNGVTGEIDPGVVGPGVYVLTYTVIAANCTSTATRTLTLFPPPVVDAGPNATFCLTNTPQTLPGGTPTGGAWTGICILANGTFTPSCLGLGNHTVYYNFTDGNGCTSLDSLTLTIVAPQVPQVMADFSICRNENPTSLTATPAGGIWTGGAGFLSPANFNPLNAPVGINSLIYTLFSNTSCEQRDTLRITVLDTAALTPGPALTACTNQSPFTLTGFAPAGGTWSGAPVANGATGLINPALAAPGIYTLTYTFTNGSGCISTATRQITLFAPPLVDARPNLTFCLTPTNQLIPQGIPAGGVWSGSCVAANGNVSPACLGLGTHTLFYTFTDGNGCISTDSLTVTVVQPVLPLVMPDFAICRNEGKTAVTATPAGGVWTGGTGFLVPDTLDPILAPAGANLLIYTVFTGTSCEQRDSLLVTVIDTPAVIPGPVVVACTNSLPIVLGGFSPSGGVWSGPGVVNGNGTLDTRLLAPGIYTLTYTYTDPVSGCISRRTRSLELYAPETAQFTVPSLTCVGAPVTLVSTTPNVAGYFWDFGVLTSNADTSVLASPTFAYTDTGTYTLTLIVTSIRGCRDTTTRVLPVSEPPTPLFTPSADSGCAVYNVLPGINGLAITFTDGSVAAGGSYSWNFGGGRDAAGNTTFGGTQPPVIYFPQGPRDTTYFVSLTLANSCDTVTYTRPIKVNPVPVVSFGPALSQGCSPFCPPWANLTIGSPTSFNWYREGVFFSSDSIPSPSPCFLYTGTGDTTYTVTLIATNGCGADTAEQTLTVFPNTITSFFNTNVTQGCPPLAVRFISLTGAPNRSFDLGDGTTALGDTVNHVYTQPGTYLVQHFANNGCSFDTAFITITVFPVPEIRILPQDTTVCPGAPVTFRDSAATGATTGYVWDFGNGATSTLTQPTYAYPAAGTYAVTVRGQSIQNGCEARDTARVVVRTPPVAAFSPVPANGCEPLTVNFTNQSQNATGYLWEFGDGNTSTNANPVHVFQQAGTWFTRLTAFDGFGCASTDTVAITVFPNPVAAFTLSLDDSCGAPATATFTNLSTASGVSYFWNIGSDTTSVFEPLYTVNQPGTYPVRLRVRTPFGCESIARDTIRVFPQPVATFSAFPPNGCEPVSVTFTHTSTNFTRIWVDFGNGDTTLNPGNTFTQLYTAPTGDTSYTVTLIADNLGKCLDTATRVISVRNSPRAAFVPDNDTLCGTPAVVRFSNTSTGVVPVTSHFWNFGDPASGGQNQSTAISPSHTFNQTGVFSVRLIAQNSSGCRDTAFENVQVFPQPVAQFNPQPDSGCFPLPILFMNGGPNNQIITEYQWDFGDGVSATGDSATHVYTQAGDFTARLVVSHLSVCFDTAFAGVRVGNPPRANFAVTVTGECADTVFVTTQNLSTQADAWLWDFGDGRTSTEFQPLIIYTTPRDYVVTLVAFNSAFGCTDTFRQTVQYLRSIANFDYRPRRGCTPLEVQFTDASTGVTDWLWDFGDGTPRSTQQNPLHVYRRGGSFEVTLYVSYQGVCRDTFTHPVRVEVIETPVADFEFGETGVEPGQFQFLQLSNPVADFFEWDFGDGFGAEAPAPIHTYTDYDTVTVLLITSNDQGCRDTAEKTLITGVTGLYIPTAMNAAGPANEEYSWFIPKGVGLMEYEIAVYDKWGNRMWFSTALENGRPAERWDGRVNGFPVTGGGYIWVVKARFKNGEEYRGPQQGPLDVIR